MIQEKMVQPVKYLAGLKVRTSLAQEMEPGKGVIGATFGQFMQGQMAEQLTNRVQPGVTFACYCEYESDEHGEYSYFVGEQVESLDNIPPGFEVLEVPAGQYVKFTSDKGPVPDVVFKAWQHVWAIQPNDDYRRTYQVDYEIWDQRAMDLSSVQVDLMVGTH